MLKVGDFSQLGQVSVRTLHHYDERGLLKPVKIDSLSNYRFYLLDRLPRLNRILAPRDLGLSLDQISGLVEDELLPDQLRGILKMRRSEIEQQLRKASGAGFDAVFEGSGSGLSRCLVKRGGILVSYGFIGMLREKGGSRLGFGLAAAVGFSGVFLWSILPNGKSWGFYGVSGTRKKHPEWFREDASRLSGRLERGGIQPVVTHRFSIGEAPQAHALLDEGGVRGRLALMVD